MATPQIEEAFVQEDPSSRLHVHGGHWRPFQAASLERVSLNQLMDKASKGAVLFHGQQAYSLSDSAAITAYPDGALMGTPNAELGVAMVIRPDPDARQGEAHSLEIVSVYPMVARGNAHQVSLRRVHVWPNRLEGQITGEVNGGRLSFFDVHYSLNRHYYGPNAELPFLLYGIAQRLTLAQDPPYLVFSSQGFSIFGVCLIDEELGTGPDELCPDGQKRCFKYFQPQPELRHMESDHFGGLGAQVDRDEYAFFAHVLAVERVEQPITEGEVLKLRLALPLLNGEPFEFDLYCGPGAWGDKNRPIPGQYVYGSFWLCGCLVTPAGEPHALPAQGDTPPQPPTDWLTLRAETADPWPKFALWDRLRRSDFATAMTWLKRAAEGGLAEAQHRLARQLEKDGKARMALAWHRRAATRGNQDSALELGKAYVGGHGLKANPILAIRWLKKAPDRPMANVWLGLLYDDFDGVRPSPVKARAYFEEAARFGEPEALARLGQMEMEQADEESAGQAHLLEAARLGHERARILTALEILSINSPGSPLPGVAEVQEWLSRVEDDALRPHALALLAMICMGRVNRHQCDPFLPDLARAREVLDELIMAGNDWAICFNAYLPLLGLNGKPDPEAAVSAMRALLHRRHRLSPELRGVLHMVLGYLAEQGIGMARDAEQALRDYRQAARLGQVVAAYLYERLLMARGQSRIRQFSGCLTRCREAIQSGWRSDENHMWLLGMIYRDGAGVGVDPVRAAAWFEIAADNHCVMAKYDLESLKQTLTNDQAREAMTLADAIRRAPREAVLFDTT